jgi:hypothetical protein
MSYVIAAYVVTLTLITILSAVVFTKFQRLRKKYNEATQRKP